MGGNGTFALPAGAFDRVFEGTAVPATPAGGFLSWAMVRTAAPGFLVRQASPLSLDTNANLRIGPPLGAGVTIPVSVSSFANTAPVHVDFTSAALAAGTNNVTFRTVAAATNSRLLACACAYTGTIAGVTLQLRVGATLVDLTSTVMASGGFLRLLPAGMTLLAAPAETWQIQVVGATLNDTIRVLAHLEEYT